MQLNPLVNFKLQEQLVLHDPFLFLNALYQAFIYFNETYIKGTIGIFGWVDYSYNSIVHIIYIFIFGYVIHELNRYKKIIFPPLILITLFLILNSTVLFIFLAMYLMWTPVGFPLVMGVQGRYFLSLFPFFLILIHQVCISLSKKKIKILLMGFFIIFISVQSMKSITLRYSENSKQVKNRNELVTFINKFDDLTKLKYLTIDKPTTFMIWNKEKNTQVTGFKFYIVSNNQTIDALYKYSVRDGSCKKEYTKGYFDPSKLKQDSTYSTYIESLGAYTIPDEYICLRFEPVVRSPKDHFFNLIFADQEPIIQILYKSNKSSSLE